MRLAILTAAASLAFAPLTASADEAQDEAVKARQGYFAMLNANMGTLAGMARGEIAYDEDAAAQAGRNLETLAQYAVGIHFLDGTSSADMAGKSNALPEIWQNMDDFGTKFAALGTATQGAGEAVKGGQGNVGPVVGQIGGACKACHDSYRAK